jgi:putative addiction module killer protein
MPEARSYQRTNGSCPFDERFEGLGDPRAAARVDTAVRKLARGLRPDVQPVGEGVQEARIHYGPGYRVYFGLDGTELVVLLLCGDKRTQREDIAFAKVLWEEYRAGKTVRHRSQGARNPF